MIRDSDNDKTINPFFNDMNVSIERYRKVTYFNSYKHPY